MAILLDATRESSAYHEAGHAVAYVAHDLRFRYITLRPQDRSTTGRVLVPPRRIEARTSAIITAAGPTAEAYAMDRGALNDALNDHDDVEDMVLYLMMCTESHNELAAAHAPYQSVEDTISRAVDLVIEHWREIDALAQRLLRSSRAIVYADARAAMMGAGS